MEKSSFLSLEGRTIVVTGASSGIGRATAVEASRQGARIIALGRDSARLQKVLSDLAVGDHSVHSYDLFDLDGIPEMLRRLSDQFGPLDGLAHCAGIHSSSPLRGVSADAVMTMLAANVATGLMLAKGLRHKQVRGSSPSIVFLSSAVGLVGQAGVSLYSASKGAVLSSSKSLALELARDNIRVNCVCPGVVHTPMTESLHASVGDTGFAAIERSHPLGLGQPEDVAKAIVFLLSDAAKWITGTALSVDGGYTAQ